MDIKKNTLLLIAFASLIAIALPACNTMEGAGKDIEKAGEKIQEKADDAKD